MKRLLIATFVLSFISFAQCAPQQRRVSVSGVGESKVVPDEISFTITITNSGPNAKNAKNENQRRSGAVIKMLETSGVDAKDYQARGVSIETRHRRDDETREVTGYVASNEITVLLRDITKIDEVTGKAIAMGATTIGQSSFSTSKLAEHRAAARKQALQAAKRKATEMAQALGVQVGKVLDISEEGRSLSANGGLVANSVEYYYIAKDKAPSVAAGVISISESVSVTFEIND
jgi:uncharacterized protein YggE